VNAHDSRWRLPVSRMCGSISPRCRPTS
jgi:hypothetical protein